MKWNRCLEEMWTFVGQEEERSGKRDLTLEGTVTRTMGGQDFSESIEIWLENSDPLNSTHPHCIIPGDMMRVNHGFTGIVSRVDPAKGTLQLVTEPLRSPPFSGQKIKLAKNNLFFLWERQRQALEEFVISSAPALPAVQAILTGNFDKMEPLVQRELPDLGEVTLDEEQLDAVQGMVHTPDFWVVWGPPGTGKTYSIAVALHCFLELGKRVFLTSHQHVAIDAVLLKLLELYPQHRSKVVRVGHSGKVSDKLQDCLIQNICPTDEEDYEDDWEDLLDRAPLVGATLSACTNAFLWDREFDVVIEDEAGRPSVPTSLVGLAKAREKFALVGDPLQLQPIVAKEASGWTRKSLLEIALGHPEVEMLRKSELVIQRRSHPEIMSHSTSFYESKGHRGLRVPEDFTMELDDLPISPNPVLDRRSPVVYITKPFAACQWYKFGPQWSLAEPYEAALAFEVAHQLALEITYPRIWLLSPFRLQTYLIASMFRKEHQKKKLALTIDQTQGGERDVVIVSITADKTSTLKNKLDLNRLNVAITRARAKLIVIGNLLTMMECPDLEEFCQWLLDRGTEAEIVPKAPTVNKAENRLQSLLKSRKRLGKKLDTDRNFISVLDDLGRIPKGDRRYVQGVRRIRK